MIIIFFSKSDFPIIGDIERFLRDILFSSLRVAELVWKEGVLIKEFPPESYTIKNIDDAFAYLKTEDGQKR